MLTRLGLLDLLLKYRITRLEAKLLASDLLYAIYKSSSLTSMPELLKKAILFRMAVRGSSTPELPLDL
jgi:hypothetical protein